MEEGLAPTDSRKRPDQRLMEEGKWDEANDEKLRLEEKQRAARRQRELDTELAVQEGWLFCWIIMLDLTNNSHVLLDLIVSN